MYHLHIETVRATSAVVRKDFKILSPTKITRRGSFNTLHGTDRGEGTLLLLLLSLSTAWFAKTSHFD